MGHHNALGAAVDGGQATAVGELSPPMGMALVAVVGLVIVALTVRTKALARGGTARRRLRKVEVKARRDFTQAADEVIQRHLAELPAEAPRPGLVMDVRSRIDLVDAAGAHGPEADSSPEAVSIGAESAPLETVLDRHVSPAESEADS